jgi:hypothetical protein
VIAITARSCAHLPGTNIVAAHRDFSYRPADVLDALAAA